MTKLEKHHQALVSRHHMIENLIQEELIRPNPNLLKIQEWKRKKLKIKEELTKAA